MEHTRRRLWLLLALLAVTLFTINVAARSFTHVGRIRARSPEPIQAWMNIPHIAHAYRVPATVLHEALELPPGQPDRRPLWQIARDQGRSPRELVDAASQAIARWRPPKPGEPPPAPPPPPQSEGASTPEAQP